MRFIALASLIASPAFAGDLETLENHFWLSDLYEGRIVNVCVTGEGCATIDRTNDALGAFDIPRNDVAVGNDSGSVPGQSDLAIPASIIADTIAKSFQGSGSVKVTYKTKETKPDGSSKETEVKVEVEASLGKSQK
jgi:hypothetical protein